MPQQPERQWVKWKTAGVLVAFPDVGAVTAGMVMEVSAADAKRAIEAKIADPASAPEKPAEPKAAAAVTAGKE